MLYLSIALVLCVVILVIQPPTITINYNKKVELVQAPIPPPQQMEPLTEEERKKLQPPAIDDIVKNLNTVMYDLGGEDE